MKNDSDGWLKTLTLHLGRLNKQPSNTMKRHVRRILVFRIGQLGDTIIALPAFWALREHFPTAHMALLSDMHSGKGYVSPEMVLPRRGLFDEYIRYNISINGTSSKLPLLSLLRRAKYDILVYLYPRGRARWQVWRDTMFFRLAGIRNFIGTRGVEPLPRSVSEHPLPTVQHESDHLLHRLALSGIPILPSGCGNMDLRLTEAERAEADDWLRARIHSDKMGLLVGIGPGSKMPAKVWPEERFSTVGHSLIIEFGAFPIVLGGAADRALGDRLITTWKSGVNGAGELSVRQAAVMLSRCRFYLGNDTGTMHLAAMVKTPCVALFSARDLPGRWYPYGHGHIVLRESVPCEGCNLQVCDKDMECLKKITVESVKRSCQEIMCRQWAQNNTIWPFFQEAWRHLSGER